MTSPLRYLVTVEFDGGSIAWTRAGGWLTTRDRAEPLPELDADELVQLLEKTCPGATVEKIAVSA